MQINQRELQLPKYEFYLSKSGYARFYLKNICVLCVPKKHAMEYHVRQGIAVHTFLFFLSNFSLCEYQNKHI